jgi:hypothetical protein
MVALDVVGTLLVGFGLYGVFGAGVSEELRELAIGAIIVGVMLMLPLFLALVRSAIERAKAV